MEFVVFIAPNKETIYGNAYLSKTYRSNSNYTTADQVVDYIRTNSDIKVVYPKKDLLNYIEEYPQYDFYYNTDTHWNNLGGYIGAKSLMDELGYNMEEISDQNIIYEGKMSEGLDLSKMMSLNDYVREENAYSLKAYTNVEFISSYRDFNTEYRFTTTSRNHKKLFVIRDSFCTAMSEYIASNFSESVMIHRNVYTPTKLYNEDPDIVVYQVVERYIRNLIGFDVTVD